MNSSAKISQFPIEILYGFIGTNLPAVGIDVQRGVLQDCLLRAIMTADRPGRGAVRLARLHGVQEVPGSIPGAPTG